MIHLVWNTDSAVSIFDHKDILFQQYKKHYIYNDIIVMITNGPQRKKK